MSDELWDGEIETAGPNPLIRLGGGLAALIIMVGIAATNATQVSPSGVLMVSLLQTTAIAAILYFTWFREAAAWKPIATTAAIFVVVMLINLGKAEQNVAVLKADMDTFSKLHFDCGGRLVVPPDPATHGPFSRATIKLAKEAEKLNDEYMLKLDQAGAFALFDADRVRVNPGMVKNCGAIIAIKADIPKFKARHLALIKRGRDEFSAIDAPDELVEAALSGVEAAMPQALSDVERTWDLHSRQIDEAHAGCRVLARGNWMPDGHVFAFTSRSDMAAFNRHGDRINDLAEQLDAIARAGQQRMRDSQTKIMGSFK
ncbi:hypothetical protein [Sphingopyxis sp. KK2]|uniref:hypothetical protein n=1 Tax=Sphingopyxis sp. KK2 TaxID=1855727 RepID=UPI00097E6257|nr:hypothetical protein [Sphingopyxis sp. KK2]